MKRWTSNLRRLLRLAIRDGAGHFVVTEGRRDGVLVVRPTQDVPGIGGRLAERGILPADANPDAIHMLFEVESLVGKGTTVRLTLPVRPDTNVAGLRPG